MNPEFAMAVGTIIANAAMTWGVMTVKLAWLRSDVDQLVTRVNQLERRKT